MKSSPHFLAMATTLLVIIIATVTSSVDAFSTSQKQRQLTSHHRGHQINFLVSEHNNRITTSCLYQQQPNFGDWTNDDFLNSLGGGGDQQQQNYNEQYDENYNNEQFSTFEEAKAHLQQLQQQQQQQQQNQQQVEMTDEEITEWAMRAAQFYNTESSVQDAYGMSAPKPPSTGGEEGEEY